MYKVRDRIKYKCPMKLENEGTIIAKFKVLDDIYNNANETVYLVSYDTRYRDDLVFERNIIEKVLD